MSEKTGKSKLISNPAIIGVGMWIALHFMARHATSDIKKNEFIDYMYMLSVEFPCGKCRTHIQEYLREHSFDPFMNMQTEQGDVGMFKWLWMFHNAVNLRLHKPYVDWNTAWEMYDTGREVCTNCSSSRPGSQANSVNGSYEDSFEDKSKSNTLQVPSSSKKPVYVDKKQIIMGYFLKKNE